MTSVSSIQSWNPTPTRAPVATTGRDDAPQAASASTPSTIVALSQASVNAASGVAGMDPAPSLMWERASRDPVSDAMAKNLNARAGSGRFSGLGAALLDQLKGGVTNLSQSALRTPPGLKPDTYAALGANPAGALHGTGDDKVSLNITTRSGVEVRLSLDSQGDGLAVQMTTSAELSEDETRALGSLSTAFQDAIDGMAQEPPQIKLAGLMQFDAKTLASVDLRAEVKLNTEPESTQTLSFHADGAQRKLSFSGAAGTLDVQVDTSKLASLGSQDQQARAMSSYMKQFDQAATRGHADGALMDMFKDAFSAMNSNYGDATQQLSTSGAKPGKWALAAEERAMLTGLADFSASVSQTPKMSNPMRLSEQDGFAYEVSQSTSVAGRSYDDRAISQQQKSQLNASFHMPLTPGTQLRLDGAAESQNYTYHQISDSASSDAQMQYKEGKIVSASLQQSSSQSERIMTYVMGKMKSDVTIPRETSLLRDLVSTLGPYKGGESGMSSEKKAEQRTQLLSALNQDIFLQAYPVQANGAWQAGEAAQPALA